MGPAPGSSVVDIPSMHGSFLNKAPDGRGLALGVMAWSVAWTAGAHVGVLSNICVSSLTLLARSLGSGCTQYSVSGVWTNGGRGARGHQQALDALAAWP